MTVSLADDTASSGDAAGDTISNFENIIGSANADTLTGDDFDNIIEGGDNLQLAGTLDGIVFVDEDTSFTLLEDNFVFV